MKILTSLIIAVAMVLSLTVSARATLWDRGGGLIYDDDLDVTWLSDANYAKTSGYDVDGLMSWYEAMTWADNLVYRGYDDWRLPSTLQPDTSCSGQWDYTGDGVSDISWGWNCQGCELGHLFYNELSGTAMVSIMTSSDPDVAFFTNIQVGAYWSSTPYVSPLPSVSPAWDFGMDGYLGADGTGLIDDYSNFAWAVRDGDVAPVPEPSTLLLLGSGLAGLGFVRRRFKK